MLNFDLKHYIELSSTNSFLKDLNEKKNLTEGVVVSADYQTSGKGQRGNAWESERSRNLIFSLLLRPVFLNVRQSFVLSQLISVSIYEILSQKIDDVSIKWPNDIYWKDQKIAGILIENSFVDGTVASSIIGVGLNINQKKFLSNAPNPVSLSQITEVEYCVKGILTEILETLARLYQNMQTEEGHKYLSGVYKKALFRKEGFYDFIDVNKGKVFSAQIKGVDDIGQLKLQTEKGLILYYGFKEIKYVL